MTTFIYTHIAKCGGNSIEYIFKNSGYQIIPICNWKCVGSNSVPNIVTKIANNRDKCPKQNLITFKPNVLYTLTHHVMPRDKLSADYIIASIRNPYDWYVSLWSYAIKMKNYTWGNDPHNVQDFQKWLIEHVGLFRLAFIQSCFANSDPNDKMIVDYFIKIDDIESSLQYLENNTNLKFNKCAIVKLNASVHNNTNVYYTPALSQLVYETDKIIFEMFDYVKI